MKSKRGFSLIEMLAAVSVFALLVVMMAQMVSDTSAVILGARKSLDADSQARLVFGLLERDFGGILKRGDVDLILKKKDGQTTDVDGNGNDEMFFYSSAAAYSDLLTQTDGKKKMDTVSVIGYRVGVDPKSTKSLELQRFGLGLAWANSGVNTVAFLTYPSGGSVPDPMSLIRNNGTPGRWDALIASTSGVDFENYYSSIAPQVFRFEYCFLLNDGTYSKYPVKYNGTATPAQSTAPSSAGTVGDRWFDESTGRAYTCQPGINGAVVWRGAGLQDVTAVVVALGILDQSSRKIVTDSRTLPGIFPSPTQAELKTNTPKESKLMKEKWQRIVETPGFALSAGIPNLAASNIHIYQRYIYLNNPQL